MEPIDMTSEIVTCYLESANWQQFQAGGHSITWRSTDGRALPFRPNCPSCISRAAVHAEQDKQYHAGDVIFSLNLFTPGTNPDDWKNTGIQCIRVQAPDRNEVIRLMQEAVINTVYAFGRQEHSKAVAQAELDKINMERNLFHMFMTKNFAVPGGQTPFDVAVAYIRKKLKEDTKAASVASDTDELLPQAWRRDQA